MKFHIIYHLNDDEYSLMAKHQIVVLIIVGSNPIIHLKINTFTTVVKMVDTSGLGSDFLKKYGFKSLL